jgi:predicted transcriptional regulator
MSNNNDNLDRSQLRNLAVMLSEQGLTNPQISQQLGIPRATIYDWVNGRTRSSIKKTTTIIEEESFDENDNPIDVITEEDSDLYYNPVDSVVEGSVYMSPLEVRKKKIEDFLNNREWKTYNPPQVTIKESGSDIALVIGDMHFGVHCPKTLNIFYKVVEELKPNKIILNGDTLDLLAVSKYTKDPRYTHTIMDEINAFHEFLKIIHDITANYNTEILETNGNHSGNGIEGRWWRYFSTSKEIVQILEIPWLRESLSYTSAFYPKWDWSRLKLVEADNQNPSMVQLPGELFVFHSDIARKSAGMSAIGNLEKHGVSTITNHTHRMGSSMKRAPKFGTKSEKLYKNYENGCACILNPTYVTSANWQNGFSIVHYSENNNMSHVETIEIEDGKAIVSALGKTITA